MGFSYISNWNVFASLQIQLTYKVIVSLHKSSLSFVHAANEIPLSSSEFLYAMPFVFINIQAHGMIEMPNPPPDQLIFEPFIETDEIIVSSKSMNENGHHLMWKGHSRWVEITVGVIGKRGSMHSLSPSITVKETGDILSLEEKFQGISLPVVIHYCTD